jgi:hypothetical protein
MKFYFFFFLIIISSCESDIFIEDNITDLSDIVFDKNKQLIPGEYIINYTGFAITDYPTINLNMPGYQYNPNEKNIILSEDTVFYVDKSNKMKKYTGIIRVVGNLDYINELLKKEVKENVTLALFNIKNGLFEGEQIYYTLKSSYRAKLGGEFFRCQIKPLMDVFNNRDVSQVEDESNSDFSMGSRHYKLLRLPNKVNFEISRYWDNGKLFYTRVYEYNPMVYILGSLNSLLYRKEMKIVDSSKIKIYHYNGNLAFEGDIDIAKDNALSFGKYYSFNKTETDFKHFKLQTSFDREIEFTSLFNLDDKDFKQYRKYFGIPKYDVSSIWLGNYNNHDLKLPNYMGATYCNHGIEDIEIKNKGDKIVLMTREQGSRMDASWDYTFEYTITEMRVNSIKYERIDNESNRKYVYLLYKSGNRYFVKNLTQGFENCDDYEIVKTSS